MEDIQSLAKQLATSPVVDQVSNIWRRAASQFQRVINRDPRRHAEESESVKNEPERIEGSNEVPENENMQRTKRIVKDLIAIGKNSGIIGPIKRAFDMFYPQGKV
ncbi:unnamed protein product, partial [Brenthis ino]